MRILAIDQGTTSTRAYLVDGDGQGRVVHSAPHRQTTPRPGHVEQDAEVLVANIRACLAAALAEGPIDAIGLDNQGETCLGWDAETGRPVGPAISWQDDRTATELAGWDDAARTLVMARAGLPLDPYFSASKLALIARDPVAQDLLAQGRLRLGTTDAWFRERLTGRCETDPATASRTSLMSLARCAWDTDLCDLFGVPVACLPAITANTGDLGRIDGIPLTAAIVDQQAALFGHGARVAGDAKITLGTGAFALTVAGQTLPTSGSGVLPTIAWQLAGQAPTYALDGGVYAAASAVDWARDLGLFADYAAINHFTGAPAIARGLAFVPALSGLACPHWDRSARGAWLGMALDTDATDLMQALLEGIAFRLAEVTAAMAAILPASGPLRIDGGLSANPYLVQFLADVTSRPVAVSAEPELTARGTAALAALGLGGHLPQPASAALVGPRPCPAEWGATFAAARDAVQRFGAARPTSA